MKFQRQLYIKNLFIPKKIINAFDFIEFNSLNAFKIAIKKDLYNILDNKSVQINICKIEDFHYLCRFWEKRPNFFTSKRVHIYAKGDLVEQILSKLIPKDMKFDLVIDHPIKIIDFWEVNSNWFSQNRQLYIKKIKPSTIETDICDILEIYNNNHLRFFKLDIDYKELSKLKLNELERIKYWFNHLKTWLFDDTLKKSQRLEINSFGFRRPIFVDDDMTLYLDNHKSKLWFFQLGNYLNDNGETVDNKVLNNFHKYIDLHPNAFYSDLPIRNWDLISFRQILELDHFLNEIPLVMQLIQRWLYG